MIVTVNCVSYCQEDGCTNDKYTFDLDVETGRVSITHEISCGFMGNQLFSGPPFVKDYGIPIPDHIIHMINMMFINNDFKIDSRYKSTAVENFIKWFTDSMEDLAKENRENEETINQLKKELAFQWNAYES